MGAHPNVNEDSPASLLLGSFALLLLFLLGLLQLFTLLRKGNLNWNQHQIGGLRSQIRQASHTRENRQHMFYTFIHDLYRNFIIC